MVGASNREIDISTKIVSKESSCEIKTHRKPRIWKQLVLYVGELKNRLQKTPNHSLHNIGTDTHLGKISLVFSPDGRSTTNEVPNIIERGGGHTEINIYET
jgi:hypothetical protein